MKIYGLKNCDSCKKALKAFEGAELVDVRQTPLSSDMIERAHGIFSDALVNTRSTTWRQMDEAQRALPVVEMFAEFPSVMKRPLIERDGELFLGWTPDVQKALGI